MANPQPDQYTKISNELLEALARFRIPGESRQVLDVIIRKTYGFNRKDSRIALNQFTECTNMRRQNVSRAVKWLINAKLVLKSDAYYVNSYRINKDYETWIRPKGGDSKKLQSGLKSDALKRKKKEKRIKITSNNYPSEVYNLYDIFLKTLSDDELKVYEPNTPKKKNNWLDVLDKCHRLDKFEYWQIKDVIEHYREDQFWKTNFYSPVKLRNKTKNDTTRIKEWYLDIKHLLKEPTP